MHSTETLRATLEHYVAQYNQPSFIEDDPISVPHQYERQGDIEIAGLWTALLSWGQRKTIIRKAGELMQLMDNAPADFVRDHTIRDRRRFENFVHRTFQYTDTLYFLTFLQKHFRRSDTLEDLFIAADLKQGLASFHDQFFALPEAPQRTRKHVPTPVRKSSCKRLNMFLRWMVRRDKAGVDFGLWTRIQPAQLYIPLDVHVDRIARQLGLLTRKQTDWLAVEELTKRLRSFDPDDPVKYDFALFGLGVLEKQRLRKELDL